MDCQSEWDVLKHPTTKELAELDPWWMEEADQPGRHPRSRPYHPPQESFPRSDSLQETIAITGYYLNSSLQGPAIRMGLFRSTVPACGPSTENLAVAYSWRQI